MSAASNQPNSNLNLNFFWFLGSLAQPADQKVDPDYTMKCLANFGVLLAQNPSLKYLQRSLDFLKSYNYQVGSFKEKEFIRAVHEIGKGLGGHTYFQDQLRSELLNFQKSFDNSPAASMAQIDDSGYLELPMVQFLASYLPADLQVRIGVDLSFFKSYKTQYNDSAPTNNCPTPQFLTHMTNVLKEIKQHPFTPRELKVG